jgi:hypothetical protein
LILLNAAETLMQENSDLKLQNRRLQDEINKLKGGNGRPEIKASKKAATDISSKGKEQGAKGNNAKESAAKIVAIDVEIKVELKASDLPADAVFKGYAEYIQQDLTLQRNNKRFLLGTYYSALEGKSYKAAIPAGEVSGHFGAGVRSLINILHHYGNVTESALAGLLEGFGIQISAGSISNLLKAEHGWAVEEQTSVLKAALQQPEPTQMDCTGNRQRGVNKTTHIITAAFFSVFYTLKGKSRLDCLNALQGNPGSALQLKWNKGMAVQLQTAGVSHADSNKIMEVLQAHKSKVLTIAVLEELLQTKAPSIYENKRIVRLLTETMAMSYYRQQKDFWPLEVLLTDDAPEYATIALFHALCWVHDARYYNKLMPSIGILESKLEVFKAAYWNFYQKLLHYKTLPPYRQQQQRAKIEKAFDKLFGQTTRYGALDLCIERTRNNKEKLLRVLDFPNLPLHNNAAELAARKVVRKRDISLHTWTDWGTQLRDAFMSIIETAKKLNISAYQYINDRITGLYSMPSLASCIQNLFTPTF